MALIARWHIINVSTKESNFAQEQKFEKNLIFFNNFMILYGN